MSNSVNLAGVLMLSAALGPCSGASDFTNRFVEACLEGTNMGEEVCECMANRGETELTDDAKTMLLAVIEGDEETARELRGQIGITDATQAGMFMTQAGACALEVGGSGRPE